MDYRITGLSPAPFRHLFGLPDDALAAHGAIRYIAEADSGYPDRIELRDAQPGERLLLVNHVHQPADTPYRASHAIFVLETATTVYDRVNEVPDALRARTISLRAFDAGHLIVDAELVDGRELEGSIGRLLANPAVDYLQAHYAVRGCYAARVQRA